MDSVQMPKINPTSIPETNATGYPSSHADVVAGRWYRRLAPASVYLAIGQPPAGACHYPDIDMRLPACGMFTRKDGSAFDCMFRPRRDAKPSP